jgi:hypothetical protein
MDEHKIAEVSVIWRGNQLNVEIDQSFSIKEFSQILQDLTNVKPDTLKFIVPSLKIKVQGWLLQFSDLG